MSLEIFSDTHRNWRTTAGDLEVLAREGMRSLVTMNEMVSFMYKRRWMQCWANWMRALVDVRKRREGD